MRFDQCTETCTADCGHCKGRPVAALRDVVASLTTERDIAVGEATELRAVFDLQWTRMQAAASLWREEAPDERAHVIPDLGELLGWLLRRDAVSRAKLGEVADAMTVLSPGHVGDRARELLARVASLTTERDRLREEEARQRAEVAQLSHELGMTVAERDAAQALLVEEQRDHAATREELAGARGEAEHVVAEVVGPNRARDLLSAKLAEEMFRQGGFLSPTGAIALRKALAQSEAELERQRPVIEAARAWAVARLDDRPAARALVAAVDALPSPTPGSEDHPSGTFAAPGEESGT